MAGENLKIQSQVAPLIPRNYEKTTNKTRGQKTFELDEKQFSGRKARRISGSRKPTIFDRRPARTKNGCASARSRN